MPVAGSVADLERALRIAAEAHAGQLKRGHEPFMAHVTRVVAAVEGLDAKIVAALHDVVEKSSWTLETLRREGFPPAIIAGVDAMTRRADEDFSAHVRRAAADPLARAVKRADLEDNLGGWSAARPFAERDRRLARYREGIEELDAYG